MTNKITPKISEKLIALNARLSMDDIDVIYEAVERIEQLEAALNDMSQYLSRTDWQYLKDETIKTLEGKDD